ncbi:hypothetical protein ACGF0K_36965 [Streptomyces sp. NPDC048156]|uniref:hypothetical protein n=1 Tax=Streptomyces sp. NPDC048156 TaxID=3365502 RepID=UPI0037111736
MIALAFARRRVRGLATTGTDQLRLWDVERRRTLGRIRSGDVANPDCVAFSPVGRLVATGSGGDDGAVQLREVNALR